MHVWPAIDLLNGAAVRLHQGSYEEVTVYDEAPDSVAARWRGRSPRLHVVDLEAARSGVMSQIASVRALIRAFGGGVQVGGGVRSLDAVDAYLSAGAERVVLGTVAIKDPDLVRAAAERHPGRIVLALDAKDGLVATDGWREISTSRATDVLTAFAGLDLAGVLYTDIRRDGTGSGPNLDATEELARASRWPVLASGGVGSLQHLRDLAARPTIAGVVVGKALHDGTIALADARAAAGDVD